MKKNILNSLLVLVVVLALGCRPKREIVNVPVAKTEKVVDHSKADAIKVLSEKQFTFETLSLKAKANLDIDGNANDVTMNIRIKNNQTIWAIITAGGGIIEVARALITPDSIKIINKLKGEYIKKPFNYIQGFTNKQVNFKMLQAILTGNTVNDFLTENSEFKQENGVWSVTGSNSDLDYKMIFNTLLKASETNLNDAKNAQALKIKYDTYQKINTGLFPGSIAINTMAKNKAINLSLNFVKIDYNVPVEFPFNISKKLTLKP
jgi:hypothetical protein